MPEIPADHPAVEKALDALNARMGWRSRTAAHYEAMAAALTAALPLLTAEHEADRDRAVEALREIAKTCYCGADLLAAAALRDLEADNDDQENHPPEVDG